MLWTLDESWSGELGCVYAIIGLYGPLLNGYDMFAWALMVWDQWTYDVVGREQFIKGDTTLVSMCMEKPVSICYVTRTVFFLIYIGELLLLQGRWDNVVCGI